MYIEYSHKLCRREQQGSGAWVWAGQKASQLPLQQALTFRLKVKLILSKTVNLSRDAIILKVGEEPVSNMTLLLFVVKKQPDFL